MSDERQDHPKTARDNSRLLAMAILAGLGILFAVLNFDEVEVNWIFGTANTPLILVIVLCLLLGFALGVLQTRRRGRRQG
jgi:uncharacterized integral membrane protein